MNIRSTYFALATSVGFAFIGHANMYTDWAQKKAVNLICDINPICNIGKVVGEAFVPSKERTSKMEIAINRDSKALSRPNVGLISSDEVLNYPYVNRYLTELDDKDISHYYILREDYTFQDLSGGSIKIPAGFIWDGASIPKIRGAIALEVGNTRYSSALAEGLIHDYMYRDPRRFSKDDADDLLYVNLVRCGNANPIAIYEGVHVAGGDSYQGHKKRQDQGLYDVFTSEFYNKNKAIYQSCRASHKPEVFDRDSQCKKNNDQHEENVCHADFVPVNEFKTTDGDDTNRVNLTGEVNAQVGVRGWCNCGADHGKRYIVGDMFCVHSKLECDFAYTLCARCGYIVHPKDTGKGLQMMDVKLYRELKRQKGGKLAWLDAFDPLKERQSRLESIPNGQIVVGGKCVCKEPDPIKVGFTNRETGEFFVCCLCGRVREPDENGNIPDGPTNLSEMGLEEFANKAQERISQWLKSGERSK